MDEEKLNKIQALYEQLESLLHGLGTPETGLRTVGGPFDQYCLAVHEIERLTEQNLGHFIPRHNEMKGDQACSTRDLVAQVSGLLGWIRGNYLKDKVAHYNKSGSPTQQVNVSTEVNVTQTMAVDITGILTAKEQSLPEGSKERTFIDKVKSGLGSVKDVASTLALITKTASELGLTAEQLHKLFA